MTNSQQQYTVTDIQPQVKQPNRYSVFLDGKFWCGLSADTLLSSKLAKGDTLSVDAAEELKQKAEDDKIEGLVLRWLAIRPRSEWELQQYLQRKKITKDVQKNLIEKLRSQQMIDDRAFAQAWVSSRRLLKSMSTRKLQLELRQKRVADEIVHDVLRDDDADELAILKELISTKQRQSRYKDKKKLMQYLSRQGFNYGDIKTALEELASQ